MNWIEKIVWPQAFLCDICMSSLCLHGFTPDALVSTYHSKKCRLGYLVILNWTWTCVNARVSGCLSVNALKDLGSRLYSISHSWDKLSPLTPWVRSLVKKVDGSMDNLLSFMFINTIATTKWYVVAALLFIIFFPLILNWGQHYDSLSPLVLWDWMGQGRAHCCSYICNKMYSPF